ncbi:MULTISPECIES: inorganic phosphate transporter [Paracoccus]|uniref:Phosphate transporter n=1 Tax=Paracoccus litorisediminis TaxID=2006130 RepID=A0A844HNV5_9RHOB|nr:inorganic phosphate transporter [Paracoccus sp. PAR01]MTH60094.1 inorganic phosphate transporter [Paracoccus litorisediminis]
MTNADEQLRQGDGPRNQWKTLDKDLGRISVLEQATATISRPLVAPGLALLFVIGVALVALALIGASPSGLVIVGAAVVAAYMALNIGANDVANNMGPAVGAKALTMGSALVIAAICETAGALIAGGDVVSTISSGIVSPEVVADSATFVWLMLSALIAAALWINLATVLGAPVSTTHSVVGGVVGAGVVAAGFDAVNWSQMTSIAASWVISPVMGGVIAAALLAFIKAKIAYVDDKLAAARKWVPILTGLMAGVFATYLALKGLRRIIEVDSPTAVAIGIAIGVACWLASRPLIERQSRGLENRKKSLRVLFSLPLIVSAALLSFAHGANDVANAVGPLAAVVHTVQAGSVEASVSIPSWVMIIGAIGISLGLMLFGPKLIMLVGDQITKLNPMRAYCVALSAAVTVIVASWLGLPVSSTHIAVGGIFGVGFFREWHAERRARMLGLQKGKVVPPEERRRRKLVRRSHAVTVAMAWVITVPFSALLSAGLYLVLSHFSLG